MEVKAIARYVRVSPRKARIVVDQVRGKSVEQAREILAFTNRAVAENVEKVLNSAVANAEHNNHLRADNLVVKAAFVDEGPTLKRIRPRAKGSASRIRKRTSHITIIVAPREEA
ncbi:MAG: 50S ribosomal protein L22 [Eggerthellaceae bacterium]|nr:50S ribosomal protein L22 [Eggerthellaceae bacterium]